MFRCELCIQSLGRLGSSLSGDSMKLAASWSFKSIAIRGSFSMELGGVSLWGLSSLGWQGLLEPMLGGGRWNNFAWSCWADGQGRVPLTHSTGSSHTAFWPWTLMPSLAPSCRYGMIEWFQRSMNHDRNSSTVTGQDKKKQGPMRKSDVLCFSRKVCKWYHSLGTQSNTLIRSSLVKFLSSSDSINFLCKYRTRKPLAGSTLLEKVTILRQWKAYLHVTTLDPIVC